MSEVILVVVGNSAPTIPITLQRNGSDISLVSASQVDLIIVSDDSQETTNSGHQATTITSAAAGEVSYDPQTTDWPSEGRYVAQAKITYVGGDIERLPEQLIIVAGPAL